MFTIDKMTRDSFKKKIEFYSLIYNTKISVNFQDIEGEVEKSQNETFRELQNASQLEEEDQSELIEQTKDLSEEYYWSLSLIQYQVRLSLIVTLYQLWEQQVRVYLFDNVPPGYTWKNKSGGESSFDEFCTKGIKDIKLKFNDGEIDITNFGCYEFINELRILTNSIKHGHGPSLKKLKEIREDYFSSSLDSVVNGLGMTLLNSYKSTLNNMSLYISDGDLYAYAKALQQFWDELFIRLNENEEYNLGGYYFPINF